MPCSLHSIAVATEIIEIAKYFHPTNAVFVIRKNAGKKNGKFDGGKSEEKKKKTNLSLHYEV